MIKYIIITKVEIIITGVAKARPNVDFGEPETNDNNNNMTRIFEAMMMTAGQDKINTFGELALTQQDKKSFSSRSSRKAIRC